MTRYGLTEKGAEEAKRLTTKVASGFSLSPGSAILVVMATHEPDATWTIEELQPEMRVENWIRDPKYVMSALQNLERLGLIYVSYPL